MNSNQIHPTSIIRVLITNLRGVIATIVEQAIQQQPDIELLGNVNEWEALIPFLPRADILVLNVENVYSPPESCFQILHEYPNLKIFVLNTRDDEAIIYWRALYCQQIQIISSQTLIESIRQIHSLSPF
ncbi:MAG: hypothetical protein KAF91_31845 [Nostoc sp. TH1S01]|nr:hypothetical protein [Nostoc sp. TH1S01]